MINYTKLKPDSRALLISLCCLVAGISAGIFFGEIIPSSEQMQLASIVENTTQQFSSTLIINLLTILLLFLAGFTVYGFPLALIILFSRGFATGFCDSLLLYKMSSSSIASFFFAFLLPQLLICTIFFFVTAISINYAFRHLRRQR